MQNILAETEIDDKLLRISPQVDQFEGYSDTHGRRIATISEALRGAFNLASLRNQLILKQAALVHDIGELKMDRDYIGSSGVLSTEERLELQRHPVIGEQETAKLGLPRCSIAGEMAPRMVEWIRISRWAYW